MSTARFAIACEARESVVCIFQGEERYPLVFLWIRLWSVKTKGSGIYLVRKLEL